MSLFMSGRPCNVYDILADLVGAVRPLALKQKREVELIGHSQTLQVAVEEPALRQALSNLIEGALLRTHVGGKIEILSTGTPGGGALLVIDDDGPDMHYMVIMLNLPKFVLVLILHVFLFKIIDFGLNYADVLSFSLYAI